MLHNVLPRQLPAVGRARFEAALAAAGIADDRRPQTLSVEEWLRSRWRSVGPLGAPTGSMSPDRSRGRLQGRGRREGQPGPRGTGTRADGYHELRSVFLRLALADRVSVRCAGGDRGHAAPGGRPGCRGGQPGAAGDRAPRGRPAAGAARSRRRRWPPAPQAHPHGRRPGRWQHGCGDRAPPRRRGVGGRGDDALAPARRPAGRGRAVLRWAGRPSSSGVGERITALGWLRGAAPGPAWDGAHHATLGDGHARGVRGVRSAARCGPALPGPCALARGWRAGLDGAALAALAADLRRTTCGGRSRCWSRASRRCGRC